MRVEHSVFIRRPPDEVFAFVSDMRNVTRWKKGLTEVRQVTPHASGVGAVHTHISEFMGRRSEVDHEITEFEPGRRAAFRITSGPFPATGYFLFEEVAGGTRLTIATEADPPGLYRLLGGVMAMLSKRQLVKDFATLKAVLEAPAPPPGSPP